jgi:type IV pilus assembly protein PilB
MQRMTKRKLGEVLLQERLVSKEQIEEALADQSVTGELLGEILVRKGYVAERNIAETVATQYSLPYLEPDQYYISGDIIHLLPMELIEKHSVVPLDRFGDILTLVVAGPLDEDVIREIEQRTGCHVHIFVSTVSAVKKTVDTLKEGQRRAAVRRE